MPSYERGGGGYSGPEYHILGFSTIDLFSPHWTKFIITDSLSHITYGQTKEKVSLLELQNIPSRPTLVNPARLVTLVI